MHFGSRTLGAEVYGDAFIGLNPKRNHVPLDVVVWRESKECLRRALEMDSDLCKRARQTLSRSHKKRNACPAPVVNEKLHGRIGFGGRVGSHSGFLPVTGNPFSVDFSRSILTPNGPLRDFLYRHRSDRAEDLDLLVANPSRVKRKRRL